MQKKQNCIPRNFKKIVGEALLQSSAGAPAKWEIIKDDCGYHGTNLSTGKNYRMSVSNLRNPDFFRITEIIN